MAVDSRDPVAAADTRALDAQLVALQAELDPAVYPRVRAAVLEMERATAAYFLAEEARVIAAIVASFPGIAPAVRLAAQAAQRGVVESSEQEAPHA